MLLSVISPKKPASWLLWKKDWSQPSAANLSKKKKWTPALKPCSRPDAHPLRRPRRRRSAEYQVLSATELPAFRRTDCAVNLPAYPPSENLTEPRQARPPERHQRTGAYAAPLRRGLVRERRVGHISSASITWPGVPQVSRFSRPGIPRSCQSWDFHLTLALRR